MNKIKIITLALFSEWKLYYLENKNDIHLINRSGNQFLYNYSNHDIIIFQTGLGNNVSFEIIDNYLYGKENKIEFYNLGLCGIINSKDFKIEDIIIPEFIQNDIKNVQYKNNINLNFKKCKYLITTKNPLINIENKNLNIKIKKSDIVDMESFFIAEYCNKKNYKFTAIKIGSDYCISPEKTITTNLKNLQNIISNVITFLINDYF